MTVLAKSFILIAYFDDICHRENLCFEQERRITMGFINGFVSYLLLLLVFVAVGGAAVFLGITLRKSANAKAEQIEGEAAE